MRPRGLRSILTRLLPSLLPHAAVPSGLVLVAVGHAQLIGHADELVEHSPPLSHSRQHQKVQRLFRLIRQERKSEIAR